MGKIEQNKQIKRMAILGAAQEIFLSEGYTLANMDHIADKAQVTKQTVYRYFPSKIDLFRETLKQMGEHSGEAFLDQLELTDTHAALLGFATGFIRAHLTPDHLKTIRLLVAESAREPEITQTFFSVGADETGKKLTEFFETRLEIPHPEIPICLWTGMLLAPRNAALVGLSQPTEHEIAEHAEVATKFLLAGLESQKG